MHNSKRIIYSTVSTQSSLANRNGTKPRHDVQSLVFILTAVPCLESTDSPDSRAPWG